MEGLRIELAALRSQTTSSPQERERNERRKAELKYMIRNNHVGSLPPHLEAAAQASPAARRFSLIREHLRERSALSPSTPAPMSFASVVQTLMTRRRLLDTITTLFVWVAHWRSASSPVASSSASVAAASCTPKRERHPTGEHQCPENDSMASPGELPEQAAGDERDEGDRRDRRDEGSIVVATPHLAPRTEAAPRGRVSRDLLSDFQRVAAAATRTHAAARPASPEDEEADAGLVRLLDRGSARSDDPANLLGSCETADGGPSAMHRPGVAGPGGRARDSGRDSDDDEDAWAGADSLPRDPLGWDPLPRDPRSLEHTGSSIIGSKKPSWPAGWHSSSWVLLLSLVLLLMGGAAAVMALAALSRHFSPTHHYAPLRAALEPSAPPPHSPPPQSPPLQSLPPPPPLPPLTPSLPPPLPFPLLPPPSPSPPQPPPLVDGEEVELELLLDEGGESK